MRTGLEVLRDRGWAPLRGLRVGLVCHPASVDGELRHAADLLAAAPDLRPGFESFLGIHPLATRHGLTIGELARLYRAGRRLTGELEIVACDGWRREMDFEQTGLPWVLPSPNMPTVDTAFVYP